MFSFFTLSDTGKKLMQTVTILSLTALVIGLIARIDTPLSFFCGLLIGTLFVFFKILYMEYTINKSLDMEAGAARGYSTGHFFLRYLLTAAVLVVIAVIPGISIWGAIIGLLTQQVAAYIVTFMQQKAKKVPDEVSGRKRS